VPAEPSLRLVTSDGETIADSDTLQGLWTVEQYLRFSDQSSRLIEFVDKRLEVLPVPTKRHQAIVKYLLFVLSAFLEPRGGTVFFAPLRLKIRNGNFREPDLMAALDANDPRLQEAYWLGADLVVEVVSDGDPLRDTVTKRDEYAHTGIPEYWIVNPLDETFTVLTLQESGSADSGGEGVDATPRPQYREHGVFHRGDMASSVLVEGLVVNVDQVFDAR
jgi:Uma2 family endonuclease